MDEHKNGEKGSSPQAEPKSMGGIVTKTARIKGPARGADSRIEQYVEEHNARVK
jgi:hypothetical protein